MALTREKIVDAALVLLEREGLQGISMRKLAQELDAGAATLYWHVGDKERLLGLMLDRIVGESKVVDPDPENWQEQVKQLGRNARELLKSRRGAAQLSMGRIPTGPNSMPVLERYLAVLHAAALPAQVIAYAADMFSLYVGAFAYEESLEQPVDSEQLGAYFSSLPPDEFPITTSLAAELVAGDADERFEWALELLVRGLESLRREAGDEHGL
ncbi:TetR/AcrR family transcriptional regulator C-terminal domain-containing protein [Solirubrobacter sp. CPCC 204708]|uniref:TetR/AcrR family transcriptional regulator n=1 Tax=Solirubrobacter deserti TaxID=2282478 RepID=A0ABT4RNB9_9ACTN|nr:TetR/AcrR family transcriptional regulator [Solirubrobacter deserti]MBE2318414.1 TetR/AcrR family transcriptional regulator C-terminal domain-containing protein [Solirubrobacter deserti]MDA0140067.1 TetR/AcrR family transcriptional regulator [Solirubrobacter deserti]